MKRPNLDEYRSWASKHLDVDFDDVRLKRIYETNANNILTYVTQHPFAVRFGAEASQWRDLYRRQTSSDLFMHSTELHLAVKPFVSVLEKTYRINVLRNRHFPDQPEGGWVDQKNLYSRMNDLVRGTVVCRFVDGPKFVTTEISHLADRLGLRSRIYSQERDDGYYAFHAYVKFQTALFDAHWHSTLTDVEVEIQVTTQLQEVLRSLTHPLYEWRRLQAEDRSGKWKWDFGSSRFKLAYLSHSLHLLESMILESRTGVLDSHQISEEDRTEENG